jgi:hypothetical protein
MIMGAARFIVVVTRRDCCTSNPRSNLLSPATRRCAHEYATDVPSSYRSSPPVAAKYLPGPMRGRPPDCIAIRTKPLIYLSYAAGIGRRSGGGLGLKLSQREPGLLP